MALGVRVSSSSREGMASVGGDGLGLFDAPQQLSQGQLGGLGRLGLVSSPLALVQVGLLQLTRDVAAQVGRLRSQETRRVAVPADVLERVQLRGAQLGRGVVVDGALDRGRGIAHDGLALGGGVQLLLDLLAAGDAAPDLLDVVDQVHAVGRLGVLRADVQVEVAAETARGEGLAAERAVLVLGGLCVGLGRGIGSWCRSFGRHGSSGEGSRHSTLGGLGVARMQDAVFCS